MAEFGEAGDIFEETAGEEDNEDREGTANTSPEQESKPNTADTQGQTETPDSAESERDTTDERNDDLSQQGTADTSGLEQPGNESPLDGVEHPGEDSSEPTSARGETAPAHDQNGPLVVKRKMSGENITYGRPVKPIVLLQETTESQFDQFLRDAQQRYGNQPDKIDAREALLLAGLNNPEDAFSQLDSWGYSFLSDTED